MHSRWRSVENECGAEHLVRMSPRETGAPGIVHLVGAGPGDPGLLTVRGRESIHPSTPTRVVLIPIARAPASLSFDARSA